MKDHIKNFAISSFYGFLGAVCCLLPILAAAVGMGALAGLAQAPRFRTYFIAVTLIALLAMNLWRLHGRSMDTRQRAAVLFASIGAYTAMLALFTYSITPALSETVLGKGHDHGAAAAGRAPSAAAYRQATLRIKGMTCSTCSGIVKGLLLQVPGASNAKVDYETKIATVVYEGSRTTAGALAAAVSGQGGVGSSYSATVVQDMPLNR